VSVRFCFLRSESLRRFERSGEGGASLVGEGSGLEESPPTNDELWKFAVDQSLLGNRPLVLNP
jgi:hypothetical protein